MFRECCFKTVACIALHGKDGAFLYLHNCMNCVEHLHLSEWKESLAVQGRWPEFHFSPIMSFLCAVQHPHLELQFLVKRMTSRVFKMHNLKTKIKAKTE